MAHARLDGTDYLSLAVGGWIIPAFAAAALVLAVGWLVPLTGLLEVTVIVAAIIVGALFWSDRSGRRTATVGRLSAVGLLVMAFLGLVLLRLAFISRTPLPLYFDSATHYQIIQGLIDGRVAAAWPLPTYYHLGYHILLAGVSRLSHLDPARLMLASGQILLAAIPISLFLLAHRETGTQAAGFFAVGLGAVGWYMPAHALNWGKYPALFSLPLLMFTLNAWYLGANSASGRAVSRRILVLAALGGCVAFLIHTRSIILLGIGILASVAAAWWATRSTALRKLLLVLTLLALVFEGASVSRSAVLASVLEPYLGRGIWITLFVGLLSVAAFRRFPRLCFVALITVVLLLGCMFVPSPGFTSTTLLDRPLVEMVLFIPLALLGSAGLAAALSYLRSERGVARMVVTASLSLAILVHAMVNYRFYPSTCCTLAGAQDLVALDWVANHLAVDARVAIPSAEFRSLTTPYAPEQAPTDAGAWIAPLTGRQTSVLPYWTDFGMRSTLDHLCRRHVTDIYVGSARQSFSADSLNGQPEWYTILLALPDARVYRVAGCTT
jgi:hypothetical protein